MMMHWLLNHKIRILAALHRQEFRHLVQLGVYTDVSYIQVKRIIKDLEERGLIETWKEIPKDADKHYRFKKIRLTPIGRKIALWCFELEKAVNESEEAYGQVNPAKGD